jgi:hypothetical protein
MSTQPDKNDAAKVPNKDTKPATTTGKFGDKVTAPAPQPKKN